MTRYVALAVLLASSACTPPASDTDPGQSQNEANATSTTANGVASSAGAYPDTTPTDDAAIANQAVTSENYAEVMSARARVYERKEYKPLTLTGFEAGDNSYVEIVRSVEGSPFEKILCTAPQCADWRDAGELPAALKNKEVGAKFGTANQVDSAGATMKRNVEAIVDFRLPRALTAAASRARSLPLTPGVYVIAGSQCENPANAAWRVWDGKGLSGSATKDCRAAVLSRDGERYTIRNSCVNTYDGSRTPETLTMTVPDQVHFSVNGNKFESCSMAQVPEELRKRVEG